jgi:hypothetical protein
MPARCLGNTPSRSCWLTYADPASQSPGSSLRGRRRSRPDRTNSAIVPRSRCELETEACLDPTRPAPVPASRAPSAFRPRCPSSKGVKNFRVIRGLRCPSHRTRNTGFLTTPTVASGSCVRPGRSTSFEQDFARAAGRRGIGSGARRARVLVRCDPTHVSALVPPARRALPTPWLPPRPRPCPSRGASMHLDAKMPIWRR